MVTYNRNPILINNVDLLRKSFKSVKFNYKVIAGIVLPDHMHIILRVENAEEFPKIIAAIKAYFSINMPVNSNQTKEQRLRREKGIWQRKYYDHIIRDENDFNRHLDYIHYNSIKHLNIIPRSWEYSSFKKFVKIGLYDLNWCNFEDKYKIIKMDLE